MVFPDFIHHVVDGDTSHQAADAIDDRQGDKVVLLDCLGYFLDAITIAHSYRVLLHDVLDARDTGARDHLLQRQDTFQLLIVINNIDVVDFIHLLGLLTHFVDTLRHTPVFIDGNHLRTHQTTGGILVVLQQIDDITRLLDILDVRKDFFLPVLVQLTHEVHGIIRLHVVHEALCN